MIGFDLVLGGFSSGELDPLENMACQMRPRRRSEHIPHSQINCKRSPGHQVVE